MSSAHEDLLEAWAARPLHAGKCFIKDGIIDEARWEVTKPKILVLLKEAYDEPGATQGWDLREALRKDGGPHGAFWTVAYWCHAAHCLANGVVPVLPSDPASYAAATEAFLSSAIINVKKSAGRRESDLTELAEYVREDGELIHRQIEIIKPDLVICGRVWSLVRSLWRDAVSVYPGVQRLGPRIFIDFCHCNYRVSEFLKYYGLAWLLEHSGAEWLSLHFSHSAAALQLTRANSSQLGLQCPTPERFPTCQS